MPNIGYGYTYEVSEEEFLRHIAHTTTSLNHSVVYHWVQLSDGFPNIIGDGPWSVIESTIASLRNLQGQIEDELLRSHFQLFIDHIARLSELETQAVSEVAQFFNLPAPTTKPERRKLFRKADSHYYVKGMSRQSWIQQPGYQALVTETQNTSRRMKELKAQIEERVSQLLETLSNDPEPTPHPIPINADDADDADDITDLPLHMQRLVRPHGWEPPRDLQPPVLDAYENIEFGDQRAKDLIDEADGEFEPREAIKLLHRALRYGKTGIQAGKAYQGLGTRYEELGQLARAIRYYSQSLEVGGPEPFTLFWRGQLFYQRHQWADAKADFEQALALGLWSPEREEAEAYLVELSKLV